MNLWYTICQLTGIEMLQWHFMCNALLALLLDRFPASLCALADWICLGNGNLLPLGTAGLIPLFLQLFAETVDHKLGADHRDTVGAGGLTNGIACLPGRKQRAFQHLTFYQFSGRQLRIRLSDHGVGNTAFTNDQSRIQCVGLTPQLSPFFTCQHSLPPSISHRRSSARCRGGKPDS